MTTLLTLNLIVLVGILIALIVVAVELHAVRSSLLPKAILRLGEILNAVRYDPASSWHHFTSVGGHFVIWEWSDGAWRSDRTTLPRNAEPGAPPRQPGAFEGECIKTWVPAP